MTVRAMDVTVWPVFIISFVQIQVEMVGDGCIWLFIFWALNPKRFPAKNTLFLFRCFGFPNLFSLYDVFVAIANMAQLLGWMYLRNSHRFTPTQDIPTVHFFRPWLPMPSAPSSSDRLSAKRTPERPYFSSAPRVITDQAIGGAWSDVTMLCNNTDNNNSNNNHHHHHHHHHRGVIILLMSMWIYLIFESSKKTVFSRERQCVQPTHLPLFSRTWPACQSSEFLA